MSDEKLLTKEIAEQFLADEYSVDLSEFTAIEDEAAEVLSGSEWMLELDGLTTLSDAAAASLSKRQGTLSLNGLTSLSDAAAEALSKHDGDLNLSGLTSLSDAAAESLSKFSEELYLPAVTSISDEAIYVLGRCENISRDGFGRDCSCPLSIPDSAKDLFLAQTLCFDDELGIPYLLGEKSGTPEFGELVVEEAEKLCRYDGFDVVLNGWYSVESMPVLQILSGAKFKSLSIRLDEVTSEVAKILAECQSASLRIDSDGINEEAAQILRTCRTDLAVNLRGLKESVRDILLQHPSMETWGQVSEPSITATCSLCGQKQTFTLEVAWGKHDGEAYEMDSDCLERNDWQHNYEDPVLCDHCKNADSDKSED